MEPQPLPPESGELIGPYLIVKALGRGGMGEVFLARDDRLNRWVAIKRIRHDSDNLTLRQRLLQEAYAAGGLRHPAIVLVYDLLRHEDDDCLVMEYVEGQTLAEALRGGPLEPALAVRLAKSVASGLAAAHQAGFLHRDLKTENVMVTPARDVKILDFGLAKPIGIRDGLTATGRVMGTRRSMSPEQLKGGEVDERSDLFSFGVLLYEMLTGCSPLPGVDAPAALAQVSGSRLPPRLLTLLAKLLAQDPAARPQSAAEVVRELEAISSLPGPLRDQPTEETLDDLPTGALLRWDRDPAPPVSPLQPTTTPPPERISPPGRPRFRWKVLLSSLALLGVLVTAGLLYRAHGKSELLWVLVIKPPMAGLDAQSQRAAAALMKASFRTLGFLRGIIPIGPALGSPKEGTGTEAVAEDFLAMTLEPSGNRAVITLSRIRGSDGKVLDDRTFTAPIDARNLGILEKEVEAPLRALFSSHPPRDDVSREGYEELFEILQRIEAGEASPRSGLPGFEKLVRRFPGFFEAQIYESYALDVPPQNHGDHERARQLVDRARALAPGDPRPLQREFMLDLSDHRRQEAQATLARLEALAPGNPEIPRFQGYLAYGQDQMAEALRAYRKLVKYDPSWRNLQALVVAEEDLGLVKDSLSHLEQILAESPNNPWALHTFALHEAVYGDPARAEALLREFIRRSPSSGDYIALADLLERRGRYTDMLRAYQEALKIDPERLSVMVGLAAAERDLGNRKKAEALFKKTLQWMEGHNSRLSQADDEMTRAYCLASLGHFQEAFKLLRESLQKSPDGPFALQTAAAVFTMAGDYPSALEMIRNALKQSLRPECFNTPDFAPLAKDPRFQQLLKEAAARDQATHNPSGKNDQSN